MNQAASLIIAGIPGPTVCDQAKMLVGDLKVGGVILFRRNIESPEQTHDLIRELRSLRQEPLLVSVDQEGGRVQRLRAPLTEFPAMHRLGETDDAELAFAVAAQLGRELRAVGFDLDFAPVVDVNTNSKNPVIGDRAFGDKPELVAKMATAFMRGLASVGVMACAKHFPGHGDTLEDSHLALPSLSHDLERLRAVEWPPFRAAKETGVASIMTAHVMFPRLDAAAPATLSRACLDILRQEIGYDGAIISDDLEMKAIADRYDIAEAALSAISAGCDAVLICHTPRACERSAALIATAASDGRLPSARYDAALSHMNKLLRAVPPASQRYVPAAIPAGTVAAWIANTGKVTTLDPTERQAKNTA